MTYKFVCPDCGEKYSIEMRMSEYSSSGHKCKCGSELKRDTSDLCKSYTVNCSGFFGKSDD